MVKQPFRRGGGGSPAGGVLTDDHAASLSGSAGTDTHAASLANDGSGKGADAGGTSDTAILGDGLVANTTEQVINGSGTSFGTPTQTVNTVFRSAGGWIVNVGATASTFTLRVYDNISGGSVVASTTTASLAQNTGGRWGARAFTSNEAVSSRSMRVTAQRTTANQGSTVLVVETGCVISGSLSGSAGTDTHAASLSGSASCSPCTCS